MSSFFLQVFIISTRRKIVPPLCSISGLKTQMLQPSVIVTGPHLSRSEKYKYAEEEVDEDDDEVYEEVSEDDEEVDEDDEGDRVSSLKRYQTVV